MDTSILISFLFSSWLVSGIFGEQEIYGIDQDITKFQGDIDPPTSTFRNALIGANTRWVNNTLPYAFLEADGYQYTQYEKNTIVGALEDLERVLMVNGKKCLTFKPRDREIGHLFFVNGKNSKVCHAPVGQPYLANYVNLGYNCLRKGTIQHEIMHALGFYHEQSRPDRDEYVTINYNNMNKGAWSQFKTYPATEVTTYGEPYDYGSILHYGSTYFSNNGKPTIVPKKDGVYIGQRDKLSLYDIRKIQKRYGCDVAPIPTLPPVGKALVECDFDSNSWCGMNAVGSAERWSLKDREDSPGNKYVEFLVKPEESKGITRSSYISVLKLEPTQKHCLQFSYRVKGNGFLAVKIKYDNFPTPSLNPSPNWQTLKVPVETQSKYNNELRIFVEVKNYQHAAIGIDDVSVEFGAC